MKKTRKTNTGKWGQATTRTTNKTLKRDEGVSHPMHTCAYTPARGDTFTNKWSRFVKPCFINGQDSFANRTRSCVHNHSCAPSKHHLDQPSRTRKADLERYYVEGANSPGKGTSPHLLIIIIVVISLIVIVIGSISIIITISSSSSSSTVGSELRRLSL